MPYHIDKIDCEDLVMSSSPHIHEKNSVRKIMFKVIAALTPAVIAGISFFGWRALLVVVFTAAACVGAEALWCWIAKKPVWNTISDGSALVTGILLAMNLSAGIPLYVALIGSFIAIWLGKQIFGGLGNNPFNPALVARVALLIAFPGIMTTWVPTRNMLHKSEIAEYAGIFFTEETRQQIGKGEFPDAVSCATPLAMINAEPKITGRQNPSAYERGKAIDNPAAWSNYFFGERAGCLGEVSTFALLIGGLMLLYWKLINWRIPVFYIGTVALFAAVVRHFFPGVSPTPLFHLFTGGLLLGAIFMATDMVTSPMTNKGCIVFGIGCGVLTYSIRTWGNYPEGVSFSILLMNALVPLIDRWCSRRPFGYTLKRGV